MTSIAFVGAQGSGKTTMADAVTRAFKPCYRLSFANALRKEVACAFADRFYAHNTPMNVNLAGLAYGEMLDPEQKKTWRPVLQAWGVLQRERTNEDYWVKQAEEALRNGRHQAIDDCRFPNEYAMLRRNGFIFVKLEPHGETPQLDHESEHHWPSFDVELTVAGTTEERMAQLKTWLSNSGYETW